MLRNISVPDTNPLKLNFQNDWHKVVHNVLA